MSDWKIIFFDLDGTLIDKDFFLHPNVVEGVQQIKKMGFRVSIATGRSTESAKKFFEVLEIEEKMIVHNGAVVVDRNLSFEVVDFLDPNIVQEIVDFHSKTPLSFKMHFPDSRIIKSSKKVWQGEKEEHFIVGEIIEDLRGVQLEGVVKVVFFEEAQKIAALKKKLEKQFKTKCLQTHLNHIEIFSPNVNKAKGIERAIQSESYGISKVIAVGDNENDLEMVQQVGMGISTGDEFAKLKTISKRHFSCLYDGRISELVHFLASL